MRSIIMSEPPAPCNFKCEYCYIPENFERRLDKKEVTAEDYLKLASLTGADEYLFWMCGIGEPFMNEYYRDLLSTLSENHKTCVVTNLSYHGNDIPESLCEANTRNLGMYWSVHWMEMIKQNLVSKTLKRVGKMLDSGIKIWPTIVMHPCYFDRIDHIINTIAVFGLKTSICRYRIGQGNLAGLEEERYIEANFRDNPNIDFRIWDLTPEAWDVAGGYCHGGRKQIIIDAWWRICTCHGDKNAKFFGTFPEDLDKVNLVENGICESSKCPCKHSVFYGVNSKFPHSFSNILEGWEDFINA